MESMCFIINLETSMHFIESRGARAPQNRIFTGSYSKCSLYRYINYTSQ